MSALHLPALPPRTVDAVVVARAHEQGCTCAELGVRHELLTESDGIWTVVLEHDRSCPLLRAMEQQP